eukprot:IDg22309t1
MRFSHGLPEGYAAADIEFYAAFCLKTYETKAWKFQDLSDAYAEHFEGFTLEMFKKISKTTQLDMRNHLYDNGVHIWKGRGKNVAKALFEVKENELPWPENVTNPALSHSQITTLGAVPDLPIVTTGAGENIIRQPVRSVQPVQNHRSEPVPNTTSATAVAPMRDTNEVISTDATTTVARTPFESTSLQSERNNRPRLNLSTLLRPTRLHLTSILDP